LLGKLGIMDKVKPTSGQKLTAKEAK